MGWGSVKSRRIEQDRSHRQWLPRLTLSTFRHDAVAGVTVAIVALPLAMALAIASGATPDRGLFTAVVAGFLISALSGSRHQVGGPTGAFVVLVYSVIERQSTVIRLLDGTNASVRRHRHLLEAHPLLAALRSL